MAASTTFVKCGVASSSVGGGETSDPLRWDCQQFPADSNSTFSPIKQEVMDTYEGSSTGQSDFTELKAMQPFDYGASLTGVDPCLSSNDSNNNCREKATNQHLNIYIKPLSPPTPSSRESFCFNASPSDVTSSGSVSPPGIIKIDFPSNQDAFDDIANIVGISCGMGADSTVPGHDTLENLDLDAWIENTANIVKPLGHPDNDGFGSILPTSSGSENSITNVSMSSTQPYLSALPGSALANLLTQARGPRVTSLEQRDPFPTNLSPILRNQLTGYQGYPQIKLEAGYDMKAEYPQYDQLPHSTMGGDPRHRLGLDSLQRNKQKPPKPRPVSGGYCSGGYYSGRYYSGGYYTGILLLV